MIRQRALTIVPANSNASLHMYMHMLRRCVTHCYALAMLIGYNSSTPLTAQCNLNQCGQIALGIRCMCALLLVNLIAAVWDPFAYTRRIVVHIILHCA